MAAQRRKSITRMYQGENLAIVRPLPEQPLDILNGVVAFVEVYDWNSTTRFEDRSNGNSARRLVSMGASVVKKFSGSRKITHVVFSEGRKNVFDQCRENKIKMVSTLWLEACLAKQTRVPESDFPGIGLVDNNHLLDGNSKKNPMTMFLKPKRNISSSLTLKEAAKVARSLCVQRIQARRDKERDARVDIMLEEERQKRQSKSKGKRYSSCTSLTGKTVGIDAATGRLTSISKTFNRAISTQEIDAEMENLVSSQQQREIEKWQKRWNLTPNTSAAKPNGGGSVLGRQAAAVIEVNDSDSENEAASTNKLPRMFKKKNKPKEKAGVEISPIELFDSSEEEQDANGWGINDALATSLIHGDKSTHNISVNPDDSIHDPLFDELNSQPTSRKTKKSNSNTFQISQKVQLNSTPAPHKALLHDRLRALNPTKAYTPPSKVGSPLDNLPTTSSTKINLQSRLKMTPSEETPRNQNSCRRVSFAIEESLNLDCSNDKPVGFDDFESDDDLFFEAVDPVLPADSTDRVLTSCPTDITQSMCTSELPSRLDDLSQSFSTPQKVTFKAPRRHTNSCSTAETISRNMSADELRILMMTLEETPKRERPPTRRQSMLAMKSTTPAQTSAFVTPKKAKILPRRSKSERKLMERPRIKRKSVEPPVVEELTPSKGPSGTKPPDKSLSRKKKLSEIPTFSPMKRRRSSQPTIQKPSILTISSEDPHSSGMTEFLKSSQGSSSSQRKCTTLYVSITNFTPAQREEVIGIISTTKRPFLIKLIDDIFDQRVEYCLNLGDAPKRTVKILAALSRGLWILNKRSVEWLNACSLDEKIHDCTEYEDTASFPIAPKYRQSKQRRVGLLTGAQVYVLTKQPLSDELKQMLSLNGATIVGTLRRAKIILGKPEPLRTMMPSSPEVRRLMERFYVDPRWLYDSIELGEKMNPNDYQISAFDGEPASSQIEKRLSSSSLVIVDTTDTVNSDSDYTPGK